MKRRVLQHDPWDFWRFHDPDGTLICLRVFRDTDGEEHADNQALVTSQEPTIEPTLPTIPEDPLPSLADCVTNVPLFVRGEIIPGRLYLVVLPDDAPDEHRRDLSHAFNELARHEKAYIPRINLANDVSARINVTSGEMSALAKVVLEWYDIDDGTDSPSTRLQEVQEVIEDLAVWPDYPRNRE